LNDDDNDLGFESASEEEKMDVMEFGDSAIDVSQSQHLVKKMKKHTNASNFSNVNHNISIAQSEIYNPLDVIRG